TRVNLGVVTLVNRLLCVDQVDSIVERSTGRVPHHPGLGIDRAFVLCRDKVEAAHIGSGNGDAWAETARSQTVRVYIAVNGRWTLSASRALIGHDDLAAIRP